MLTTAFVACAIQLGPRSAVWLGMAATVVQVLCYYAAAELSGFDASGYYVLFWSLCAVVGGPAFGAAGHLWGPP